MLSLQQCRFDPKRWELKEREVHLAVKTSMSEGQGLSLQSLKLRLIPQ